MKLNFRKYSQICLLGVFTLIGPLSVSAENTFGLDARKDLAMLSFSADENPEKNVSNVKVIYNPIVEQISVTFKLAKQSTVVIKLMDALGNEVLSLANSNLEGGNHSLAFDTESKLSEGIYFIRVSTGTEVVTKRVVIR